MWALLGEGQTRQSKHFLQSLRYPGYKVLQEGCISFPKNLLDRYTVLLPEEGRKQFSIHHWSTPTFTKPIPFHYHTWGQSWLPKNKTLASKLHNSPGLLHSLNSIFSWWLGTLLFSQSKPAVTPPKPGSQSQAWRRTAPDELAPGLRGILLWHLKAFTLIAFSKTWIYRQGT